MSHIIMSVSFAELWKSSIVMPKWQAVLMAIFFAFGSTVLCTANWFLQQSSIMEYGYPKVKGKTLRKQVKEHSITERIFLTRLCREAKRKGFMLILCWSINFINVLIFCASVVGAIGFVITSLDGWAGCLLIILPFGWFCISVLLHFIPDLLFLPSERERYKRKK